MTGTARPRVGAAVAIILGTLALAAATVVGWNEGWLDAVVAPPPIVRAALVGGSVATRGVAAGAVGRPAWRAPGRPTSVA